MSVVLISPTLKWLQPFHKAGALLQASEAAFWRESLKWHSCTASFVFLVFHLTSPSPLYISLSLRQTVGIRQRCSAVISASAGPVTESHSLIVKLLLILYPGHLKSFAGQWHISIGNLLLWRQNHTISKLWHFNFSLLYLCNEHSYCKELLNPF